MKFDIVLYSKYLAEFNLNLILMGQTELSGVLKCFVVEYNMLTHEMKCR